MEKLFEISSKAISFIIVVLLVLPVTAVYAESEDGNVLLSENRAIAINDNIPSFNETDMTLSPYCRLAQFDDLGRTGCGEACLSAETLTDENEAETENTTPTGWQTASYEDIIEDGYLYQRCHVIAHRLSGLNGEPENIFTGTRQLNQAMLAFENAVYDYIAASGNHVLYKVTPLYFGNDLVASAVEMEALSIEDNGEVISFNVLIFNRQDGIVIDYLTGESFREIQSNNESIATQSETVQEPTYVVNKNTLRFHETWCDSCTQMNPNNKQLFYGTRDEAIAKGYIPCGNCKP